MTEFRNVWSVWCLLLFPFLVLIQQPGTAQSERGLRLTLSPQNDTSTDVRRARTVSLYVEEGEPVSPFLPSGPFTATWEGALTFPDFGKDVTISARGRGTLSVTMNGKNVFEGALKGQKRVQGDTVGIRNGKNPLTVTYESPEEGDAWVRLYWEADDFYHEPLPVKQLVHERTDRMKQKQKRRKGRALFLNHRCVACHQDKQNVLEEGANELNMDAPDLSAAGTKFRQDWLANWIADPQQYRPDTSMPAVLHGKDKRVRRQAKHIAAYLSTCTNESASGPDVTVSDQQVSEGSRHFRRYGCVACHTVEEAKQDGSPGSYDRVSLSYVAEKWKPGPLAHYLMNPRAHYDWNPMPDFRLNQTKAKALAAFLIEQTSDDEQGAPAGKTAGKGRPKRGKKLMKKKGCNRCHAEVSEGTSKGYDAPPLHEVFSLDGSDNVHGCLAEAEGRRKKAPEFNFPEQDTSALVAYLSAAEPESLSRSVPAEFAARQVDRLNCTACHRRDGQQSVWSRLPEKQTKVELDQERTKGVKQLRPPLTWVGDMLQYDWLKNTIHGTLEEKTRPMLVARMPGFGPYSSGLAEGLAAQHGYPPERMTYTDSLKKGRKGKRIVETLNCYSCHAAGDRKSNTFEVAGINFVKSGKRLHRNFAIRWTLEPGRVRGDTGMPAFFQWGEPSPLSNILDGNLHKQMKALWHYLQNTKQLESD
jgi:mono/diheme cytochrome c family protein